MTKWASERDDDGEMTRKALQAMWPSPWQIYVNTGHNRARIVDATGEQIFSRISIEKARAWVGAVNRDHAAAVAEKVLERIITEHRRRPPAPDEAVVSIPTDLINACIDAARLLKGLPARTVAEGRRDG